MNDAELWFFPAGAPSIMSARIARAQEELPDVETLALGQLSGLQLVTIGRIHHHEIPEIRFWDPLGVAEVVSPFEHGDFPQ